MTDKGKIITVGLSPAWDVTCRMDGIEWEQTKKIGSKIAKPAGKALNVSRGLAWLKVENTAAGLWGLNDYDGLCEEMIALEEFIKANFTPVAGNTRQNYTIIDDKNKRQMHLRSESELIANHDMQTLAKDLSEIVDGDSICVFSGAMPKGGFLADTISIMQSCADRGAKLIADTSGDALEVVADAGRLWVLAPNVEELCGLLGEKIKNESAALAKAGAKLLDKAEIVLISRGEAGAIVVTKDGCYGGKCVSTDGKMKVAVGCGDWLLAGFLAGLTDRLELPEALEKAIITATVKCWGLESKKDFEKVQKKIKVEINKVS